MNSFDRFLRWALSILIVCTMAFALGACEGDDGKDGAAGRDGVDGEDGAPAPVPDAIMAAIDMAQVESCATCHGGAGDEHQAVYNQYADASRLGLEITDLQSTDIGGGDFSLVVDFDITWDSDPYIDPIGNSPSLDSTSFYFAEYDIANDEFVNSAGGFAFSLSAGNAASNGDGSYTLTQTVSVDTDAFTSGALVGRIANGKLVIEERQAGKRVNMYADNASDHWEFGNVNAFASVANVEGCEACHGAPYFKHGHYPGAVADTPDFTICKSCHNNTSAGGHPEWQHMLDNPLAWATGVAFTPEEEALYAYDRTLVNDVHMSHAMEFPYPQSMATCSTCHAGNVDQVLADENFTVETCKSCHAMRGIDSWPDLVDADTGEVIQEEGDYYQSHRPPPMAYLWADAGVDGFAFHNPTEDCNICHKVEAPGFASTFADLHTGYDPQIYNAGGDRFDSIYTVSIDDITMVDDLLTIDFSASDAAIQPEVLVSFYGWGSKQFIVASHSRDGSDLCPSSRGDGCRMEFAPGDTSPLFAEDPGNVAPVWSVTLDMAAYLPTATLPDDIPTMIGNNVIRMAEVTVTPELELDGVELNLDAVTQTFDVQAGGFVAGYFKGAAATVDTAKCDACHDQLAVTFHGGSGRGGDIVACKNCHVTTNPGSHMEMASRAIDSYVHAIHTFQPFDLDDVVNADDPVETARNALHIEHAFPYFTAQACEACHVAGTYNVPDQSQSMPGVLSASWDIADRNIGTVPEAVTGPASRACGGCHRAELINEDKAGDLASFNAHTEAFGTYVENDADDLTLYGIIDKIMTWFE
jgi:OmcA/MtrC family decaheme c-type cytochrome